MADVTYREAVILDAGTIIGFQIAMADETEGVSLDRATVTSGVNAIFANPHLGRYFVAAAEGEVVASMLITYEWSDWRNGMVWWIQSVYVVPAHRGAGVYRGLYQHVKSMAEAEASIRGIRLYVDERNTRAREVYTRLGMDGEHYRVFEWMK